MTTTIYERIYNKLNRLIPDLETLKPGDSRKSSAGDGFMDLNLDVLSKSEDDTIEDYTIIALSHYYKQNGDMVADPDMEIKVYNKRWPVAEALTYQDSWSYERVYPDAQHVIPKLKKRLNSFLDMWLRNCLKQKHNLSHQGAQK